VFFDRKQAFWLSIEATSTMCRQGIFRWFLLIVRPVFCQRGSAITCVCPVHHVPPSHGCHSWDGATYQPHTTCAKRNKQVLLLITALHAMQTWSSDEKSVRPSVIRCPLVPQRGSQKRKTADFRKKMHFAWRKSATKFLCVKTVSGTVVRHSLA